MTRISKTLKRVKSIKNQESKMKKNMFELPRIECLYLILLFALKKKLSAIESGQPLALRVFWRFRKEQSYEEFLASIVVWLFILCSERAVLLITISYHLMRWVCDESRTIEHCTEACWNDVNWKRDTRKNGTSRRSEIRSTHSLLKLIPSTFLKLY